MNARQSHRKQMEEKLAWCVKWHLVEKRYMVKDGRGDWYYQTTALGTIAVIIVWLPAEIIKLYRLYRLTHPDMKKVREYAEDVFGHD